MRCRWRACAKAKAATTAFARQADELVGKVAKRTLLPGRFVPLAAVRDAYLVQQGARCR